MSAYFMKKECSKKECSKEECSKEECSKKECSKKECSKKNLQRKGVDMRTLYDDITERLKKVDFSEIWLGFHLFEFALYDSKRIVHSNCELPWNEKFVGNTAIQYEGNYIAIWKIEDDQNSKIDTDELTANLVHEMFHAFQMTLGETRFPDDLLMLHYPEEIHNRVEKYEENKEMAKALREENPVLKQQHVRNFCKYRQQREERLGTIIKQEFLIETGEGMAEYAGMTALRMLNYPKYKSRIEQYATYLESLDLRQLDLRLIDYYSGASFLLVMKELGCSIIHPIGNEEKSVFEVISDRWSGLKESDRSVGVIKSVEKEVCLEARLGENLIESDLTKQQRIDRMKQLLDQKKDDQRRVIKKFREKELHKITGEFHICGYDPMNLFFIDGLLYCSTFMAVSELDHKSEKRLFGESLMELIPGTYNKVSAYYYEI